MEIVRAYKYYHRNAAQPRKKSKYVRAEDLREMVRRGNEALLKQGINPYKPASARRAMYSFCLSKGKRRSAMDILVEDLLRAVQKYEKANRSELIKRGKEMERRRQSKQA